MHTSLRLYLVKYYFNDPDCGVILEDAKIVIAENVQELEDKLPLNDYDHIIVYEYEIQLGLPTLIGKYVYHGGELITEEEYEQKMAEKRAEQEQKWKEAIEKWTKEMTRITSAMYRAAIQTTRERGPERIAEYIKNLRKELEGD